MTALAQILAARIRAHGPMSLADYMADCLLHPQHGYYTTQNPFGSGGDFITAPDISQMFGELLGLSLAQAWLDQGAPNPFTLAELGPGRGTLLADVLRATRGVPGFFDANPQAMRGAHAEVGIEQASYYRLDPLRRTLAGLIDFDCLKDKDKLQERATRLTVGCVNVCSGDMRYFDSRVETGKRM
jgi:SAM-dependent MidA family methyltransferase